jgi:hypothetical protein
MAARRITAPVPTAPPPFHWVDLPTNECSALQHTIAPSTEVCPVWGTVADTLLDGDEVLPGADIAYSLT